MLLLRLPQLFFSLLQQPDADGDDSEEEEEEKPAKKKAKKDADAPAAGSSGGAKSFSCTTRSGTECPKNIKALQGSLKMSEKAFLSSGKRLEVSDGCLPFASAQSAPSACVC
jgi:hypothetical protein